MVCRTSQPVRIITKYCTVIHNFTRKEKDGSGSSFRIVAHVEKACEVQCFTNDNLERQIIPVIGRDIPVSSWINLI